MNCVIYYYIAGNLETLCTDTICPGEVHIVSVKKFDNRTSVPTDPKANMNAAEDFLLLLLHAHVTAAAKIILSYNPTDSAEILANRIGANFIGLPSGMEEDSMTECEDEVYLYSTEFLSLAMASMMLLRKLMETAFYGTGSFC